MSIPGMLDARQRVAGQIEYTIDRELPGLLHARVLRSTQPHARIVAVDTSRARRVPGVVLVATGADVQARKGLNPYFGPIYRDQPVLAIDRVRFVGDPVVAAVALDVDAAQEALGLIEVQYEPLPAVFTPDEALADGAPLLHPGLSLGATFPDIVINQGEPSNACNHFRLRKGDVEAGMAEAYEVFEDSFTSPPVQHVPMETHACVAEASNGRISVVATTQTPHVLRAQLAEVFGVPLSSVRVVVPTLGGGYGAKCYPKVEPLTAVLAYLTRRPVRLHLSREEEFVTITKHGVRILLRTGVRRDGTIIARRSTCHFNTGAYADIGPRLIKNGGFATAGPYAIPNVWVDSYAVYTNLPPAGAFRGYGVSQAAWAYETQMDMIAERMGIDPLELRRRNLLTDGQTFATGETLDDCHFGELLDRAVTAVGWEPNGAAVSPTVEATEPSGRVRGKGFSCIIKGTVTPSTSTASVKLNEDGSLNVLTSSVEMGQGMQTAMAILAAERMGIAPESVSVSQVDTDVAPYDQQTSSSRSSYSMGSAVRAAVDHVREQLLDHGSKLLEVGCDDLEITDGQVRVKGLPGRGMDLGEIVRSTRSGNLLGHGTLTTSGGLDPQTGQGVASVHWHQAAGAAEVEVDLETGRVEVLHYHGSVYAGRVINPVQAELQTEGSVAFGLGQALFEEMSFDGGQLQNGNLGDYMIPSFADLPKLEVSILEDLERAEIHGIGETSLPPVMPAVGNAVYAATGVRITDLPITPEKILRGLRERQAARIVNSEEVVA